MAAENLLVVSAECQTKSALKPIKRWPLFIFRPIPDSSNCTFPRGFLVFGFGFSGLGGDTLSNYSALTAGCMPDLLSETSLCMCSQRLARCHSILFYFTLFF